MSAFYFATPPYTPCPACAKGASVADHNVSCSHDGERSYQCAVNVPARTVEAAKMRQGAGVKAAGGA